MTCHFIGRQETLFFRKSIDSDLNSAYCKILGRLLISIKFSVVEIFKDGTNMVLKMMHKLTNKMVGIFKNIV